MKGRYLTVVLTLIVAVALLPGALAGQSSNDWTPPQTPWGDPDLQGIWNNSVSTPLERPSRFGDKQFLSDEELAAYTTERQGSRDNRDDRDAAPGTTTGRGGSASQDSFSESSTTDVARAYAALWFPVPEAPIRRTSLISDPPDGKMPELTPQAWARAEARAEAIGATGSTASPVGRAEGVVDGTEGGVDGRGGRADNPEDRDLGDRCITRNLPRMPGGYNNHFQIVQTPDHVVIEIEMGHHVRIIPIDGRPHLDDSVRQWMGDPRGHWEGNTLVVETTHFDDKGDFRGSGENRHLVERFTPTNDQTIDYEVRLEDSTAWASPWTVQFPLRRLSAMVGEIDEVSVPQMFEFACHEGNYGLLNILAGARKLEMNAAQASRQ
jgi:hypothetical protein